MKIQNYIYEYPQKIDGIRNSITANCKELHFSFKELGVYNQLKFHSLNVFLYGICLWLVLLWVPIVSQGLLIWLIIHLKKELFK